MGNLSLENILPVIREQLELLDEARCFSIMVTNLETVVYIDDNSWLCDYVTIGEALTSIPRLEKVILNRKRLDEKVNLSEAHITCRIYATPVIENDTVLGVIAFLEKLPDDVTKAPYL